MGRLFKKSEKQQLKKEKRKTSFQERLLRDYAPLLEYKNGDYTFLRILAIVLKRKRVYLIIMTMLVFMCSCLYFYTDSLKSATVTMMFNYEESSKRLAPNETRYNIADFTSDEVLKAAIKNAGMEDVLTVDELIANIDIKESFNRKPVDEQNYYIPTSYKVSFTNPKQVKGITTKDMLQIICNAYVDYFYNKYTMKPTLLKDDYSNIDGMEYNEIASFFTMRIDELSRYLNMRNQVGGEFKSGETGETFSSLRKMVTNVGDYALKDYKAYIWENGIVKQRISYKNTLLYLNQEQNMDRIENYNEYLIRRDAITYYSTPMSTSILIPSENQKNDYYMARTKTGVDYLASDAEKFLGQAKYYDLQTAQNQDKYSKIKETSSPEQIAKADEMVNSIKNEMSRIEKIALATDKDYTYDKSRNYITFKFTEKTLLNRLQKKNILFITALFFLVALFAFYKECSMLVKRGGVR